MAMPSSGEFGERWATAMARSIDKMRRGAERVTEAPGEAAAREKERYRQATADSVDKWAARVASVSLDEWRRRYVNKGLPRVATGATEARNKMEQFWSQFQPHLEAGVRQVRQMPRTTLEDRLQRMVAMARHNSQFRMR